MRFIGVLLGIFAVYFTISGAIVAYAKENLESADYLLIGFSMMMLSHVALSMASKHVQNNTDQPTLP